MAIGLNVMLGNIGGLVSTWSYVPWDAPDYHIGHGLNLATMASILLLSSATYVWMGRDNKKRERDEAEELEKLGELSEAQWERMDYKHPSFRWRL